LNHLYGEDHPANQEYNKEEFERRKRENKKRELRHMLDKYVNKGNHHEIVAQEVKDAQKVQKEMGKHHNKVQDEMSRLN